jgi:hypothetical protein
MQVPGHSGWAGPRRLNKETTNNLHAGTVGGLITFEGGAPMSQRKKTSPRKG